jgi:hypothetical protein
MINVTSIIENFLSDNQKSNKNFTDILNLLVSFLQSDTFKNITISPLNFSLNMSKITDIDLLSDSDVISKFNHIMPFSDKIMSIIYDYISPSDLIRCLKNLHSISGSNNYLTVWNNIMGDIIYSTVGVSDTEVSQLNINSEQTLIYNESIELSNVRKVLNPEDLKVDYNTFIRFLMEAKNINTLFLLLSSTKYNLNYTYYVQSGNPIIIEDVINTTRYNCEFQQPFIKNTTFVNNKSKYQTIRNQFNNFYTFSDVSSLTFEKIKDEGYISVFTYESDDNIIFYQTNKRAINHLNTMMGENLMFDTEILNDEVELNLSHHKNPSTHQSIIELDFQIITIIGVQDVLVVLSAENPIFLS